MLYLNVILNIVSIKAIQNCMHNNYKQMCKVQFKKLEYSMSNYPSKVRLIHHFNYR